MAGRIRTVLEMIKFEHSVFALPFALTGALLAARATHQPPRGWPTLRQIVWIIVAMVGARSAAMTINRIADVRYDRENPRTKQRALATGALSLSFAWVFTLARRGFVVRRRLAIESAWRWNFLRSRWPCCFSIPTPSDSRRGRTWCWDSAWVCRRRRRGSPSPARSTRAC